MLTEYPLLCSRLQSRGPIDLESALPIEGGGVVGEGGEGSVVLQ